MATNSVFRSTPEFKEEDIEFIEDEDCSWLSVEVTEGYSSVASPSGSQDCLGKASPPVSKISGDSVTHSHKKLNEPVSSTSDTTAAVVSAVPAPATAVESPHTDYPTISFMDFQVGNIGLFFPINKEKDIWMAFNSNKPNYFVAHESLPTFINKENSASRMRILGKIFFVEKQVATNKSNPYNLPVGTEYHKCHCEKVFWRRNK